MATSTFIGMQQTGNTRATTRRLRRHHREAIDDLLGSEVGALAHLHLGHTVDVGTIAGRFLPGSELMDEDAQRIVRLHRAEHVRCHRAHVPFRAVGGLIPVVGAQRAHEVDEAVVLGGRE